ncbi:MAG: ABC transporter permease, partial [Lachnospiraceae bacterium]|nr:ABC transporter permease [Lachnospiraceae bacterium]
LTMLGIIIGIGAVICIDTLGNSLTKSVTDTMETAGGNTIYVSLQQKETKRESSESGFEFRGLDRRRSVTEDDKFTDEMILELCEKFPDQIKSVQVSTNLGNGIVKEEGEYANVSVTGILPTEFISAKPPEILAGTDFDDAAYKDGRAVAMVSDYFCDNLYNGDAEKAIGKTIEVTIGDKYYEFTISGVYKYNTDDDMMMMMSSNTSKYDTTTQIYVPLKNIQEKTHSKGYQQLTIIANPETVTNQDSFMADLKQELNKYYVNNQYFEPSTFSMSSMFEEFTKLLTAVKGVFAGVAAISLLVGGIGVMNIMLVSISERTREIGTRKALGASNTSIRTQFIVEAMVLCLIGGILGIITGISMGVGGVKIMEMVSKESFSASPSIASMVIAVLFSLAIGVFFGYYPANKAAQMNPIDALRYE